MYKDGSKRFSVSIWILFLLVLSHNTYAQRLQQTIGAYYADLSQSSQDYSRITFNISMQSIPRNQELWIFDFEPATKTKTLACYSSSSPCVTGSCSTFSNRYAGVAWTPLFNATNAATNWPSASSLGGKSLFQTYQRQTVGSTIFSQALFSGPVSTLTNCTDSAGNKVWQYASSDAQYVYLTTTGYFNYLMPGQTVGKYTVTTFSQTFNLQVAKSYAAGFSADSAARITLIMDDMVTSDTRLDLAFQTQITYKHNQIMQAVKPTGFFVYNIPNNFTLDFYPSVSAYVDIPTAAALPVSAYCTVSASGTANYDVCTQEWIVSLYIDYSGPDFRLIPLTGTLRMDFDVYSCTTTNTSSCTTYLVVGDAAISSFSTQVSPPLFVDLRIPIAAELQSLTAGGALVTSNMTVRFQEHLRIRSTMQFMQNTFKLTVSRLRVCYSNGTAVIALSGSYPYNTMPSTGCFVYSEADAQYYADIIGPNPATGFGTVAQSYPATGQCNVDFVNYALSFRTGIFWFTAVYDLILLPNANVSILHTFDDYIIGDQRIPKQMLQTYSMYVLDCPEFSIYSEAERRCICEEGREYIFAYNRCDYVTTGSDTVAAGKLGVFLGLPFAMVVFVGILFGISRFFEHWPRTIQERKCKRSV